MQLLCKRQTTSIQDKPADPNEPAGLLNHHYLVLWKNPSIPQVLSLAFSIALVQAQLVVWIIRLFTSFRCLNCQLSQNIHLLLRKSKNIL